MSAIAFIIVVVAVSYTVVISIAAVSVAGCSVFYVVYGVAT